MITPQQLMTVRLVWMSLVFSVPLILFTGVFTLARVRDLSALSLDRVLPTGDDTTVLALWAGGFAALASSFVLPKLLGANKNPAVPTLQRAYVPFLLSMALAEACTLMGLVAAAVVSQPAVPELMFLPAAATFLVGLTRCPTARGLETLAGEPERAR